MSISRRGLIAAGLAVAAVGTMGVVSTMNASASDTPIVVSDDDAAPDLTQTPPKFLPSGALPRPVRKGRWGASSAALAAAGASAASDAPPASSDATAFGPKGQSGLVDSSVTAVAPPLPPTSLKAAAPKQTVNYLYAGGKQWAEADGASGLFTVSKPKVASEDWHSLAELAVQSQDEKQIVEVGWTVDPSLFGDNETHLFVYHWVDGQGSCYNCDFVSYSRATVKPGDILAENTYKLFGIQHSNGAWWIAYDTEWIGSFPDRLWDGNFTKSGLIQVFGEIATPNETYSCSQMGSAKDPAGDFTASRIGTVSYINGPYVNLTASTSINQFQTAKVTDRTFRYGGAAAPAGVAAC